MGKIKIFIGNMPNISEAGFSIRNAEEGKQTLQKNIQEAFERFGEVAECVVMERYGFVRMEEEEAGVEAVKELNGMEFFGRPLRIERSTGFDRQDGASDRGRGRGRGRGARGRGSERGGRGRWDEGRGMDREDRWDGRRAGPMRERSFSDRERGDESHRPRAAPYSVPQMARHRLAVPAAARRPVGARFRLPAADPYAVADDSYYGRSGSSYEYTAADQDTEYAAYTEGEAYTDGGAYTEGDGYTEGYGANEMYSEDPYTSASSAVAVRQRAPYGDYSTVEGSHQVLQGKGYDTTQEYHTSSAYGDAYASRPAAARSDTAYAAGSLAVDSQSGIKGRRTPY